MHAKLEKVLIKFAYIGRKDYFCTRFKDQWFGSSVGLEQQPSKLWVLGSNPSRITQQIIKSIIKKRMHFCICAPNKTQWVLGSNPSRITVKRSHKGTRSGDLAGSQY